MIIFPDTLKIKYFFYYTCFYPCYYLNIALSNSTRFSGYKLIETLWNKIFKTLKWPINFELAYKMQGDYFTWTNMSATLVSSITSSRIFTLVSFSMACTSVTWVGVTRVTARPLLPARAVLPTRCM